MKFSAALALASSALSIRVDMEQTHMADAGSCFYRNDKDKFAFGCTYEKDKALCEVGSQNDSHDRRKQEV